MAVEHIDSENIRMPEPAQVERAIRLTYIQMMLGAIFAASTGGMFLIGFAIKLGADNVLLGLMATIPQYFVVFQFLSAYLVERGVSRKRLTVSFAFMTPLCWFFIAVIPFFNHAMDKTGRFTALIGVISLVTLSSQFIANARASWIGDLVPKERRGRFFGLCGMFAGLVGAFFAIVEGRALDILQSRGLFAFTGLFFFGALFGLASAYFNIPQPDCPLPNGAKRVSLLGVLKETRHNRNFVTLAITHAVMALGGIAGPFSAAYCLRDVGMGFFGLGLVNSVGTVAILASAPFWGRLVDRFGCRPMLILGFSLLAPASCGWFFIPPGAAHRAYWILPCCNLLSGVGSGAVSVAISTMMYKASKPQGRAVQFAAYSVFVTLVAAPMPLLGGLLVSGLNRAGFPVDLRLTFYLWGVFMLLAALIARRLRESDAAPTGELVFEYFPRRLAKLWESAASLVPFLFAPVQWPGFFSRNVEAEQSEDED